MFVDRRKILLDNIGSGTTIDITLKSNFFPVDNAELIEDKFVKDEVENSINPIIDYKKIIFKPEDELMISQITEVLGAFAWDWFFDHIFMTSSL